MGPAATKSNSFGNDGCVVECVCEIATKKLVSLQLETDIQAMNFMNNKF